MHWRRLWLCAVVISLSALQLTSCATAEQSASWPLPSVINESSGLWCNDSQLVTLNDSGNKPELYQLTHQGEQQKTYTLNALNRDWEALAGDEQAWYVADIGNNSGKRHEVVIYKVPRNAQADGDITPHAMKIRFADRPAETLNPLKHDFDAEALVARDDHLLLFSKSWKSGITRVYKLDKQSRKQLVSPIANLDTSGWLVTGAALDETDGSIVLVGYQSSGLLTSQPVIARVSADLSRIKTQRLTAGSQVEAVCVLSDRDVLYTQERGLLGKGHLYRLPFEQTPSLAP